MQIITLHWDCVILAYISLLSDGEYQFHLLKCCLLGEK